MMTHTDLLMWWKERRRVTVNLLACDDKKETAAELADIQMSIIAIEAVMAEATPSPEDLQGFVDNIVIHRW